MKKKAGEILEINEISNDATANIVFDTIKKGKQALLFVNSKPRAEHTAEELALKVKVSSSELLNLSEDILSALPRATKQCEKLAFCVRKGIAFHHAGLVAKQRELIENAFRKGDIKIICCTPTLAAGVDLPAFRTIIKDLKRFGSRFGMSWIPVLEYLQMSGRAGRPKFDTTGESILIAQNSADKRNFIERYIKGEPEEIYSKLAVEPVLRTYVLSLIASEYVNDRNSLLAFFNKTFWAYQYKDKAKLGAIIDKMLKLLSDFQFISMKQDDFVSADKINNNEQIQATKIGKRVAELYIDPLTAHHLIVCMKTSTNKAVEFSYLQMISHTLEMYPLLRVKTKEYDEIENSLATNQSNLLEKEPTLYDLEYEEFLNSIKTALMFQDWIDEKDDEYIMERYDVRPGELRVKLDKAEWLLYSSDQLANVLRLPEIRRGIAKLRFRLKYGAKEELFPLLKLENIGRTRARKLFNNRIKDISDLKNADITAVSKLIGKAIAIDIKKQVGQDYSPEKVQVKEGKRKGQISLRDFS